MQNPNKQEKIWGLYPGILKKEELENLHEADVWVKIDNLSNYLFWTANNAGKPGFNTPSPELLQETEYALEYLIYYTRHFGVEFSKEPSTTEHVEKDITYSAWYSFWYDHFSRMPKDKFDDYINDKFCKKDITKYMPTNSWKSTLSRIKQQRKH